MQDGPLITFSCVNCKYLQAKRKKYFKRYFCSHVDSPDDEYGFELTLFKKEVFKVAQTPNYCPLINNVNVNVAEYYTHYNKSEYIEVLIPPVIPV